MPCPHADIRFCPLYVALHDPAAAKFGCDDGHLGEGGCAVERGLNYADALGRLMAARPRFIAEVDFMAEDLRRRDQRARNMRLSGVH